MEKPSCHVASEREIGQRWLQGLDGRRLYEYVLPKGIYFTPVFVEFLLFISICCTLTSCVIVIYEISLSYNVNIKCKVRMYYNSVKQFDMLNDKMYFTQVDANGVICF